MSLSSTTPNVHDNVFKGGAKKTNHRISHTYQLSLVLPHIEDQITSLESAISKQNKVKTYEKVNPFLLNKNEEALLERLIHSRKERLPAHVVEIWRLLIPALIEMSHHILNPELALSGNLRMARQIFIDSKRENNFSSSESVFNDNTVESLAIMLGVAPHSGYQNLIDGLLRGSKGSFVNSQNAYARSEATLCMELILTHIWYKRHREHAPKEKLFIYTFIALSHLYWDCSHSKVIGHLSLEGINPDSLIEQGRSNYYEIFTTDKTPLFLRYVTENLIAMRHVRLSCPKRYGAFLNRDPRWITSPEQQLCKVAEKYVRESNKE